MTAVRVPGVKGWVIAGHGPLAMPPSSAFVTSRWAALDASTPGGILRTLLIATLHAAALGLMLWSEVAVLADANARLGADVDRYSFTVADLHRLLLAGLCRRTSTRL